MPHNLSLHKEKEFWFGFRELGCDGGSLMRTRLDLNGLENIKLLYSAVYRLDFIEERKDCFVVKLYKMNFKKENKKSV